MTRLKPYLFAALLSLTAAVPHTQAQTWGLPQLMQSLAQTTSSRASFVEKKYVAALDAPLESSGELYYVAPDRLEKRTLKPRVESMVLDKNTLTLERGPRKRSFALQSYPEIGSFVESIRATLAGDHVALERNYQVVLEGQKDRWILNLKPLDKKTAALVSSLRLSGQRERVDSIEIFQADGNRSVMTITPLPGPAAPSAPSPASTSSAGIAASST